NRNNQILISTAVCTKNKIPVLTYSVDSVKTAKAEHLSVEQSARKLRYDCFFDAIRSGKCTKVATAHHLRDNAESVLINLFRGTGIKGVSGINANYSDKIIRPFLSVSKEEINRYINENAIPYVTDETNFDDDYTRNFIRLHVLPKIKEIFPEAEKSIARFSAIAKIEDEFMDEVAEKCVRVFASKDDSDAGVSKVNVQTGKPEKIANSPAHCFIWNDAVNGVKLPDRLDRQWYIDFAKKRLKGFGVM
ncbi:MAG: tRNA lysidine(34) synthetase TilS, partial [Clostridia bacterium]|nr:tRNA lysidine(34) synthetase TilS [Clostridia bacterium]